MTSVIAPGRTCFRTSHFVQNNTAPMDVPKHVPPNTPNERAARCLMSNIAPTNPRVISGNLQKRAFMIVASKFNAKYVQGLVDHACEQLRTLMPGAVINVYHVPGAFEIPIVVRELAMQKKADGIIAIGAIIKGHTGHAENLARSVTDALQRIALGSGVPVINAVLSLDNESQARERCLEDKINRGTEAANAAIEITGLMAELRGTPAHG